MASSPKRVRSDKKIVWNGKKQVRFVDDELKTFDTSWEDVDGDLKVYDTSWKTLQGSAELDVYDSNEPTFIGTVEDGVEATYTFKDYDGTVLKTGKVKDGETPVAPADPTREATAEYTYTFSGWNPAVGPIAKNTEFVAQYTATKNTYTVTISSNNTSYGTVDESSVTVEYGTAISASNNVLTIGETEVTATAESGYEFSSWGVLPATVTENLSITATFEAIVPPATPTSIGVFYTNGDNIEVEDPDEHTISKNVFFEYHESDTSLNYIELDIDVLPNGANQGVTVVASGAIAQYLTITDEGNNRYKFLYTGPQSETSLIHDGIQGIITVTSTVESSVTYQFTIGCWDQEVDE